MYYTVYKITNLLNNKIYIGAHKTKDPYDNYMGSSKYLSEDIEKYGIDNFKKEILYYLDSEKEMYEKERELVNEDFIKLDETYNKIPGGSGSFTEINLRRLNIYGKNGHIGYGGENLIPYYGWKSCKTPEIYKKIGNTISKRIKNGEIEPGFLNKTHKEDTKKVIGNKSKIHQKGSGNSQFGTKWIHSIDLKLNKKIQTEDPIPEGWIKGRKLKF